MFEGQSRWTWRGVYAGKAGAKVLEDAGENVSAYSGRGGNYQRARLEVAKSVDGITAFIQGLENMLGVRQETAADFGEPDAATGALEEALAQVALQGLNPGRHGRLSQEEGFGRPAEGAVVSDLEEGLELRKFHVRPRHRLHDPGAMRRRQDTPESR